MSDKKNQKKVGEMITGAKEKAGDFIDSVRSQPVVKKGVKKVNDVVSDIKEKVEDAV